MFSASPSAAASKGFYPIVTVVLSNGALLEWRLFRFGRQHYSPARTLTGLTSFLALTGAAFSIFLSPLLVRLSHADYLDMNYSPLVENVIVAMALALPVWLGSAFLYSFVLGLAFYRAQRVPIRSMPQPVPYSATAAHPPRYCCWSSPFPGFSRIFFSTPPRLCQRSSDRSVFDKIDKTCHV